MRISAWELVAEEPLNMFTWRLRVPGGWLYRRGNTDRMIFVSDAEPDVPDRLISKGIPADAREILRRWAEDSLDSNSTQDP